MKRIVNHRKKQVEYVIPEKELREKLNIPEPIRSSVYYSTSAKTLKIFCEMPEAEK